VKAVYLRPGMGLCVTGRQEMTEPTSSELNRSPGIATISPVTWMWWVHRQVQSRPWPDVRRLPEETDHALSGG